MSILDTVNRAKAHLREHGRVSLRMLKREFELDDDALDEQVTTAAWARVRGRNLRPQSDRFCSGEPEHGVGGKSVGVPRVSPIVLLRPLTRRIAI